MVSATGPASDLARELMDVAVAMHRKRISVTTKAALAELKASGVRLGPPRSVPDKVAQRIANDRSKGLTMQAICDGLARDGIPTARGGASWSTSTIQRILNYAECCP